MLSMGDFGREISAFDYGDKETSESRDGFPEW